MTENKPANPEDLRQAALDEMTGGFAHRLKNVLSAIRLSAEIGIKKGSPDSEDKLHEIIREVDLGYPILEQIAILADDCSDSCKLIDLRHFFMSNESFLRQKLTPRHSLVIDLPKAFFWSYIDPELFLRILGNLIDNSRRAMLEEGTLSIKLSRHTIAEGQPTPGLLQNHADYIRIDVADTGLGISESDSQRIFDPFFTTHNPSQCAGLGLTVVYCLIQQLNGWLEVETAYKSGTTVSLFLPYYEEEPSRPSQQRPKFAANVTVKTPASGSSSVSGKATTKHKLDHIAKETRATVLFVEDEDLLREVTHEFLLLDKYAVCSVRDSEQALQAWDEHAGAFDLLITDFLIPGLNGMELANQLKQHEPGLKVIYTSAFDRNTLSKKHGLPEEEIYISKPYTFEDIRTEISKIRAK